MFMLLFLLFLTKSLAIAATAIPISTTNIVTMQPSSSDQKSLIEESKSTNPQQSNVCSYDRHFLPSRNIFIRKTQFLA